jgi:hypothetical protein
MWRIGRIVLLTHDEVQAIADEARARGYHAGLQSKWRTKKVVETLQPAGIPEVTSATWPSSGYSQGGAVELKTYGDSLPLPNRNAETYGNDAEYDSQFNMKESEMEDAA